MIHISIPPFLTYVRSEYLYDLKEGFGYFGEGTVFAISSYPDSPLTFQVMVDNTTLFSNVPVFALTNSKTAVKLSEDESVFFNCPDEDVAVSQYEYLISINDCCVWKRDDTFWQKGSYLLTIDWWKSKKSLHLIELEDGNYILWPNEKITWGADPPEKLPTY